MIVIPKINPSLFELSDWRNGSPIDLFGCQLRDYNLQQIKPIFLKYAIGYCDGESLVCRPKRDHKAVLFFKNEMYYWFHFTNQEFESLTKGA